MVIKQTNEKSIRLSAEERETIIIFNDDSAECEIYTCSKPLMTKLDKLCKANPDSYRLIRQDAFSKTYTTKKTFISFRSGKVERKFTKEQKEQAASRLRKVRGLD